MTKIVYGQVIHYSQDQLWGEDEQGVIEGGWLGAWARAGSRAGRTAGREVDASSESLDAVVIGMVRLCLAEDGGVEEGRARVGGCVGCPAVHAIPAVVCHEV